MLSGSIPAMVTPFRDGDIDFVALEGLVAWHIDEGSAGLVPVGTTGESPTLSHREHVQVVERVVRAASGRIPIIAGSGSNSTREAIDLTRAVEEVGADAALVVTPYYNKPTQEGLYVHFKAVHDACGLPIIIYNIPGRSIIDMMPGTMGRLAELPRIVGVKDATGDVVRVSMQREACGTEFLQLSGEDASALGFNAHGGRGCISVTANIAPGLCQAFQAATLAGDLDTARVLQDRLLPLHQAIFLEPGVAGAKYGLSLLGQCRNEVRLPLTPVNPATETAIRRAMESAHIIGPGRAAAQAR